MKENLMGLKLLLTVEIVLSHPDKRFQNETNPCQPTIAPKTN